MSRAAPSSLYELRAVNPSPPAHRSLFSVQPLRVSRGLLVLKKDLQAAASTCQTLQCEEPEPMSDFDVAAEGTEDLTSGIPGRNLRGARLSFDCESALRAVSQEVHFRRAANQRRRVRGRFYVLLTFPRRLQSKAVAQCNIPVLRVDSRDHSRRQKRSV